MLVALMMLSSCSAAESFMSSLGFDMHDYSGEAVTAEHTADSDISLRLADMVQMLLLNTPYLEPFSKMSEALDIYRDAVLNYMLGEEYAKYSGNLTLLDSAAREYPQLVITTAIPVSDFEAVMYRCFGGSDKVTNRDGKYFTYLDKISAYTAVSGVITSSVEVTVTECVETKNTYRLTFYNTLGSSVSPEYTAMIIKREDGTLYFKSLTEKQYKQKAT